MHGVLIALIVEEVLKTCPTFDFPNSRHSKAIAPKFSAAVRGPRDIRYLAEFVYLLESRRRLQDPVRCYIRRIDQDAGPVSLRTDDARADRGPEHKTTTETIRGRTIN